MFDITLSGEQITRFRKEKGLTQEDLAEKLQISPQAISKWENGHTMPEVKMLIQLCEILDCSADSILNPKPYEGNRQKFDYEFIVSPKVQVGDYTGPLWPKSISCASLFAALKLFMGLESRRDTQNRQMNDDEEYIFQSAISNLCFGYSWGPDEPIKDCYSVYGLDYDKYNKSDYTEEQYITIARRQIERGSPVIVYPDTYSDVVFATGYSCKGRTLKGLGFLDGDDEKNARINFNVLNDYDGWYANASEMILIKPGNDKISLEQACVNTIRRAVSLLTNIKQIECKTDIPHLKAVYGCGFIVYKIWCDVLAEENRENVDNLDSLMPHIAIHYENKLRTKQFFERCAHIINGADKSLFSLAIKQYDEIIDFAGKIGSVYNKKDEYVPAEFNTKRNEVIYYLGRSKELDELVISYIKKAMPQLI